MIMKNMAYSPKGIIWDYNIDVLWRGHRHENGRSLTADTRSATDTIGPVVT